MRNPEDGKEKPDDAARRTHLARQRSQARHCGDAIAKADLPI
jgi:hypothetical protein